MQIIVFISLFNIKFEIFVNDIKISDFTNIIMDEANKIVEFKKIKIRLDNGNLLGPFDVYWLEENREWLENKRIEWDNKHNKQSYLTGKQDTHETS